MATHIPLDLQQHPEDTMQPLGHIAINNPLSNKIN